MWLQSSVWWEKVRAWHSRPCWVTSRHSHASGQAQLMSVPYHSGAMGSLSWPISRVWVFFGSQGGRTYCVTLKSQRFLHKRITKSSIGCSQALEGWAWCRTRKRIWLWCLVFFLRQNKKRSLVHQSIKQLLATRNKEEFPFWLGLYRWECFALLLHLWC